MLVIACCNVFPLKLLLQCHEEYSDLNSNKANFYRWSQFMRDGANTSRQQNTTTSINSAMTQRLNQVEATAKPAVPDSPFLKRVVSRPNELCAVCLEKVRGKKKVMRLPCSHKYHSDCVLPWLAAHPDCPCCRTAVPATVMLS